jgi:hypothetical protein
MVSPAFREKPRRRRRGVLFLLHAALWMLSAPLFASEASLSVDKRVLSPDDSVVITLVLSGPFAGVQRPVIPLQNLVMQGEPSESTELSWINGVGSHRRTLTFTARPRVPGAAMVGPLTLRAPDGQVQTLAAISLQVLPDAAAESNDPQTILRALLATGRDPIFLVAEADKPEVWVGEEAIVTWTLYNATNVQQYGIADIPKLADFWTEELDVRDEHPDQVVLAGTVMQKLVIRRVALFPLRSGRLTVEPMAIDASVMKRVRSNDPFGMFEGALVDVHRRAAALSIGARPLPPGPPVAAVGEVELECGTPSQKNGGPVTIDVTMSGRANLRGAPPSAWSEPVDGSVEIVGGKLTADHRRGDAVMTRRWRLLLFPAHSGAFTIPALTSTILTPVGERRTLRCERRMLMVEAVDPAAAPPPGTAGRSRVADAAWRSLPLIGVAAILLVALAMAAPRLQRALAVRRGVRALARGTPEETRAAVDEWLAGRGLDPAALLAETSDRGDAYRALRSLLDGAGRIDFDDRELRDRLREVLRSI